MGRTGFRLGSLLLLWLAPHSAVGTAGGYLLRLTFHRALGTAGGLHHPLPGLTRSLAWLGRPTHSALGTAGRK